MWANLFLKGWLIGFSVAVPVGPIGILCIRHSLTHGRTHGLVAGLGAACADACYGALAAFAMTLLCDFFNHYQIPCQLVGAGFLCYLGITTLLSVHLSYGKLSTPPSMNLIRVFFMAFLLTLTNPLTALSLLGIYAALGINLSEGQISSMLSIATGIFIGSTAWWLLLSFGTSLIRKKISPSFTCLLNQICGIALLTFGLIVVFMAFQSLIKTIF